MGVAFAHYGMPGLTREGAVHVGHGMRVAWFKDPMANTLDLKAGSGGPPDARALPMVCIGAATA